MGEVKQINIKNRTYYFYNDMIGIKNFDAKLLKLTKNHTKTMAFTTLGILQRKKLRIVKIFTVWIHCIYLLIVRVDMLNPLYLHIDHAVGYVEEKCVNKYLVFDSTDQNKELLKNMMFAMELKTKSKKYVIVSVIMKKMTLNLILMIIYH